MKPDMAMIHIYRFLKILLGFILVFLFIIFIPYTVLPADDNAFSIEERKKVLTKAGELLANNYVDPSIGEACKILLTDESVKTQLLKNTHPRSFLKELNTKLQKVHNDKHVRVRFIPPEEQRLDESQPAVSLLLQTAEKQSKNFGFERIEVQTDNVGYLKLTSFPPADLGRGTLLNTLDFLQFCDALIIDLRENRGGSLDMVKLLAGFFFPDSILFSSYYWRRGDYVENYWTVPDSSRTNYWDVPVYILLSSKTFSAAEDFAFGMHSRKRATLIGEQTGGGANPGYTFSLNEQFSIFIPTGRAISPVTGKNWEAEGIEPDIKTSAGNALILAVEQAGLNARMHRQKRNLDYIDSYQKIVHYLEFADSTSGSEMINIEAMLNKMLTDEKLDEWTINRLAYHYLANKKLISAYTLFRFNQSAFSNSANANDSLAEYFYKQNVLDSAMVYYKKVLTLDPKAQNARFMLHKIKTKL